MPRGKPRVDPFSLAMELVSYELQKQRIEEKIREIKSQLSGKGSGAEAGSEGVKQTGTRKRVLSAGARRRIAAAQRKRWAEHRKKTAQAAKSE